MIKIDQLQGDHTEALPDPLEHLCPEKRKMIRWRQERQKNALEGTARDMQHLIPKVDKTMRYLLRMDHIRSFTARDLSNMQRWPRGPEGIRGHLFFVFHRNRLVEIVSPEETLMTPKYQLNRDLVGKTDIVRSELFLVFDLIEIPVSNKSGDGKHYEALRVLRFK